MDKAYDLDQLSPLVQYRVLLIASQLFAVGSMRIDTTGFS